MNKLRKDGYRNWEGKRFNELLSLSLLPDSTLESVGKHYGISRERVRQVFERGTGTSYGSTKKALIDASVFKCVICGATLPRSPRYKLKTRTYCSIRCYNFSKNYDIKTLANCDYCHKEFLAFRNHRFYLKSGITRHSFCCIKHYISWGQKHGTFSKIFRGRPKKKVVKAKCVGCGIVYDKKLKRQKYHSRKCFYSRYERGRK